MFCGYTYDQALQEIAKKDVPNGVSFEIISADKLPECRTFRGAWTKSGNGIAVDIKKAQSIANSMRRLRRAALFAPLDIEATIPAKAQQAEAARQAIRDNDAAVQGAINSAQNHEDLKAILKNYGAL
jgi:hypothetical protein